MKTIWRTLFLIPAVCLLCGAQLEIKTNRPPAKVTTNAPVDKATAQRVSGFQQRKFPTTGEVPYEVEVFMLAKQAGQYLVEVQVSELQKEDGQVVRRRVGNPRITTTVGQSATLQQKSEKPEGESVEVALEMPPDARGEAGFKVTVKRGDKVTGEAGFKLPLTGRGGPGVPAPK